MNKHITHRSTETDREGVNGDKLGHFFDVMLKGKTRGADAYLRGFTDFDIPLLSVLTRKRILSLLLDVDGCIATPYGPIQDQNLGHIDNLQRDGVAVGVYSNCQDMPRLDPLRKMGIPIYDGAFAKPARVGFLDACRKMNFDPQKTWMVGDNPLTDGGAVGVLGGVAFVEPIAVDPRYVTTQKKAVALAVSGLLREMAITRTLFMNPQIHRMDIMD